MSKTVIQMAKEAGFPFNKFGLLQSDDNCEIDADQMLERLVELARADERAKLAAQPAPVQGWRLVPVKPTKEMVDALADTDPEHDSVWDAVLSAAPQAQRKPLTLQELEAAWNAQADHMNTWNELGLDEIVAWAQAAHNIKEKT